MSISYMNKILCVDSSNRKSYWKEISEDVKIHYIGGKGIGIQLLWDNFPKGDPFDVRKA